MAKRLSKSAINWQRVTERLCTGETPRLASEVNKMKGQNSDYLAQYVDLKIYVKYQKTHAKNSYFLRPSLSYEILIFTRYLIHIFLTFLQCIFS